ncbi:MAG: hypothetical protein M1281_01775 [Chloroflexi bacterium]|nr:hypothetical protein [Chloroflexota bacterium]
MMTRKSIRSRKSLFFALLLLVFVIFGLRNESGLAAAMPSLASSSTPDILYFPSPPTPFPPGYKPPGYRTATPDFAKLTPYPTPTNPTWVGTHDLSPNLPLDDKFYIVIQHGDGTREGFFVGPPAGATQYLPIGEIPPEILKVLNLKQDDKVITCMPPVPYRMMGPPTREPEQIYPTPIPYPTFNPLELTPDLLYPVPK